MKNILPVDGEAYLIENFFNNNESMLFFETLIHEIPWMQTPIKMFGKDVLQPRLTAWCGEKSYRYSGQTMVPEPWSKTLLKIKTAVEKEAGVIFTGALLNYYRNEMDSMGWHRDNEKELGENPIIASVSFGASRLFSFKHYYNKGLKESVTLTNGSLLLMKGPTQHFWLHSIPKVKNVVGPRINITFRVL